MKKTNRETKKLSIETLTVRRLETELTPEQLQIVGGGATPQKPSSRLDSGVC